MSKCKKKDKPGSAYGAITLEMLQQFAAKAPVANKVPALVGTQAQVDEYNKLIAETDQLKKQKDQQLKNLAYHKGQQWASNITSGTTVTFTPLTGGWAGGYDPPKVNNEGLKTTNPKPKAEPKCMRDIYKKDSNE